MALIYDKLSAEGVRDIALSLAGGMETGETISSCTVVSRNPTMLGITNKAVNGAQISQDGVVAEIGEAVQWTVTGLVADASWTAKVDVAFVGTTGSTDSYVVTIPVGELTT